MINLKEKPYFLNDDQIKWVNDTLASLSLEDKIKQLFTCLTASRDENYLKDIAQKEKFGGVRFNPGKPADILKHNQILQKSLDIPALICANCEAGGNGACNGGTEVGVGTKVGSTHDLSLAYQMGYIGALEAKQLGINTLFAPIVDIHHDFHNPIIAYKCFSNDAKEVKDMSLEFLKGCEDNGILACAKHFPGDGFDERDQHLSPSVNPLSTKEWDESFGLVYSSLINANLPMIMVGHIKLPSYQKYFNPKIVETDEYLPASVSKEIITDLLRNKLGFNGVITTDATHMVGLTSCMKREDFLPGIIAAGVDMILFYNDFDEDMKFMMNGYKKGTITEERLNESVTRILGLKAKIGLNKINKETYLTDTDLSLIGCAKHQEVAKEVSKKGICLIKEEKGVLPLNKEKIKKILIVPQHDENPFESLMPKGIPTIYDYIKAKLEQEGFEVEIFESLMDKAKKAPPQEAFKLIGNVYNNKTPISGLTSKFDLIIQVCDFDSHNTTTRLVYKMSKGTPDVPWYVYEVPTIMISLRNPFHLFDAPQVKTYINCYDKNKLTIDCLVDKLMGRDKFIGRSSVDALCNMKY